MQPTNLQLTTNKGFLLTRQSFDRQGKAEIILWLSTETGSVKLNIIGQQPVFFIAQSLVQHVEATLKTLSVNYSLKQLGLNTFSQEPVAGLYFNNLSEFYDARSKLEQANITFYEGSIRLEDRYLMERFVYGSVEFIGEQIHHNSDKNYTEYTNVKIKPSDYVPKLKIVSLDIECSEKGELYSIGFYSVSHNESTSLNVKNYVDQGIASKASNTLQRVIMINPEHQNQESQDSQNTQKYIQWVLDELALLKALQQTIQQIDPDIIIGWNVINFDFRLLYKRAELHNLKLRLGRGQTYLRWRDSRNEKNQGYVSMDGRVVVDGIAAMKAESYVLPSFSLEAIGQRFLGKGKATDNVSNRMESINYDFKHNKIKLAQYNLQDCVLVWEIFNKIKLMDYLIFRSQLTGLELDRAGGSVAAFVNLYLPKLHRHGYISPNLPVGGGLASPGGYVMNSKPGLYKQVIVLDFKSLYPSIIRTFKIDPLGLIEGQKDPDNSIEGFKGGCFSRDQHLLPDIITDLWRQRDQAKKDQDAARSQAIKIIMNSFYGVLGSSGCPFYDTRLASSITLRGHEIMQLTTEWVEQKGLEVIYGDTDSIFVLLGDNISDSDANSIGASLAEYINSEWQLKLKKDYQLECYLELEFESHFSRFLMPTIRGSEHGSKKRYAGLLKSGEQHELIFKGLENVRTDWTLLAKNFQKQLYKMVFNDQDPTDFIVKTVSQTLAGKNDTELVYRKRLRRSLERYVKNIPPHVRAARLADAENLKRGKPLKHQNKGWISYLMTVSGPQPTDYVSAQIDYQFYVDRQIAPVADAILPFIGLSFKPLIDRQMGLF